MISEFAPAKVNLSLHVVGRRPDGLHDLDSVVVFADVGDQVRLESFGPRKPDAAFSATFSGPFARALADILLAEDTPPLTIETALQRLSEVAGGGPESTEITLEKNLPIAAGIGGGSSDAAAALRAASRSWGLGMSEAALSRVGAAVGSDVPACVHARALRLRGAGEDIAPLAAWPAFDAVLANPGVATSTGDVFAAFRDAPTSQPSPGPPPQTRDRDEALRWLAHAGNDLEAAATRVTPSIGDALAALAAAPGCRLSRMSGSGATCFGLFDDAAAAAAAAAAVADARPAWWVTACRFGGAGGDV